MRFFTLLVILSCAASAYAALPLDAYRIETLVANQTETARNEAIKAHLADVIVRVAGDAHIVQNPLVSEAINNASSYLQQFSYVSDKENKASTSPILVLTYSATAIDKLILQTRTSTSVNTSQKDFLVRVIDAQDFAAFKQIQSYFKSIALIKRSELRSTNKDSLEFSLTVDGDAEALTQALVAGNKLHLADKTDINTSLLQFRWQR